MSNLSTVFKDALFPPLCVGCRKLGVNICADCYNSVKTHLHHCPFCFTHTDPLLPCSCGEIPFATQSLFYFEGLIKKLIYTIKYTSQKELIQNIPFLLDESRLQTLLKYQTLPKTLLIPISLHPQRLKERGFNQALEIAKQIAPILKSPIDDTVLTRIKNNTHKASLQDKKQRIENTKNLFIRQKDIDPDINVILIDDVITTGATFSSAAGALGISPTHIFAFALAQERLKINKEHDIL